MDSTEFEGLLYTILSEEPLKNQIIHVKKETNDYTISDYVTQRFSILIVETMK